MIEIRTNSCFQIIEVTFILLITVRYLTRSWNALLISLLAFFATCCLVDTLFHQLLVEPSGILDCSGLASHPGGIEITPSRFILKKPGLCIESNGPVEFKREILPKLSDGRAF